MVWEEVGGGVSCANIGTPASSHLDPTHFGLSYDSGAPHHVKPYGHLTIFIFRGPPSVAR